MADDDIVVDDDVGGGGGVGACDCGSMTVGCLTIDDDDDVDVDDESVDVDADRCMGVERLVAIVFDGTVVVYK
jgi:hypothetical protein